MNENKRMNRRRFLRLIGGAVGASALACSGLAYFGTRRPSAEMGASSCGDSGDAEERILVAYASRTGSTAEVAETIGDALCNQGAAVDVRPIKDVNDISNYQAVIIGSAIRAGSWLGEATKFVETHQAALRTIPTAYFLCCMTLAEATEENFKEVDAYLDPVREILAPTAVGLFAGKMDYSKLSVLERTVIKALKTPEGDFRDWDAIRAWGGALA